MPGRRDYGFWSFVVFNIAVFAGTTALFLIPRRHCEWRSLGMFSAFIVALYTEMYGFPLTLYLLTPHIMSAQSTGSESRWLTGNIWCDLLRLPDWATICVCNAGILLSIGGLVIVGLGWWELWRRVRQTGSQHVLVVDGPYRVIRHPQYFGILLIIIGGLIQWPTFATMLMAPLLVCTYRGLALQEENELKHKHGASWTKYEQITRRWRPGWKVSMH